MKKERRQDVKERQAGFTLLEMIIALVMLLSFSGLVTSLIISGGAAQKYASRLNRVTEISQELMDEIHRELRGAVRLFENNAIGNGYRSRIQTWPSASPINSSVLPVITPGDTIKKDLAGSAKTGNEMLLARHAWADTFECTSGNKYQVDIYRMVRYFLKLEGGGPDPAHPWGLNLVKWVSEPLASASQLGSISDPMDKIEMIQHLVVRSPDVEGKTHAKVEVSWEVGADPAVAGTFQQMFPDGSLDNTPAAPRPNPWLIQVDDRQSNSDLVNYRHHSVASNYAQANVGVGRFGIIDNGTGLGFPHGFEIQVVGPAAARQVLVHLTLVSINNKGMKAYYDIQAIMGVREG